MSFEMVVILFIAFLSFCLAPVFTVLVFAWGIGYIIYICVTPHDIQLQRDIEKEKRRTLRLEKRKEKLKSRLSDERIREFIAGGTYEKFDNEPVFIIIREYRNKLLEVLNTTPKISVNIKEINKVFGKNIVDESEFIEYLKNLYIRRDQLCTKFSWFNEKERKALSKLDLLKKYDYYNDLTRKWQKAHYAIGVFIPPRDCWEGLPNNSEYWWISMSKGEV